MNIMRIPIMLVLLFVCSSSNAVIDTIRAASKITDVTVFFTGAQVTRKAPVHATAGKHLVIFDSLPGELNPQSIQASKLTHANILAVKHHQIFPVENRKNEVELQLEKRIDAQEVTIKEITNEFQVFTLEEKLLLDNSLLDKNDGGSQISDIREAADFYRERINEIRKAKLKLANNLEAANKDLQELFVQLNEATSKRHKTYSQVLISIECTQAIAGELSVSYYIASSGWIPNYDFRVDDISKPLVIVYNADVFQTTGEDWENVRLVLSSGDPELSGSRPEIVPWHLGSKNPYHKEIVSRGAGTLRGRVLDKASNEPLPFANVIAVRDNQTVAGAQSDFDGQFVIKPLKPGKYTLVASFVGYIGGEIREVPVSSDKITFKDFLLNKQAVDIAALEIAAYKMPDTERKDIVPSSSVSQESVMMMLERDLPGVVSNSAGVYEVDDAGVTLEVQGSRNLENSYYVEGSKFHSSYTSEGNVELTNNISHSLSTNVTNLEYNIEIPYTIPSDGKDYSIRIKDVSMDVAYIHHAVPKLDNDVFLTAEIADWSQLNLLSGKSNIFYQGTYTGESFIDAGKTSDTLSISLGRDRNILVERTGDKQLSDRRLMGNNYKETVGWEIIVRNNKNVPILIVLEDQFPVSERKSIEVEQQHYDGAELTERTGKLTWKLQVNTNETKKVRFSYVVKYPRYSALVLD